MRRMHAEHALEYWIEYATIRLLYVIFILSTFYNKHCERFFFEIANLKPIQIAIVYRRRGRDFKKNHLIY